uniref:Pco101093a n=1 Tax=Arundo donax TaxID=35708 RepID=A0A0A9EXS9_ARUDO
MRKAYQMKLQMQLAIW